MTLATTISFGRRLIEEQPYEGVTTGYTAGSGTIAMADSTAWKAGEVMEGQDAGGQLLVTTDGSGGAVPVRGAHNGTTDATIASGVVMLKDPRFSYIQWSNAIQGVAEELFPEVWVEATTNITPSATADIYNLPSDYEGFIDLIQSNSGSVTEVERPIHVAHVNAPTGVLASGRGLRIYGWYSLDTNATLIYKTQATTSNMPGALERIVARGAATVLLENEAARLAGDPSEVAQSQVRSALTTARFEQARFEEAVRKYAAKLNRKAGDVRRYTRVRVIGA